MRTSERVRTWSVTDFIEFLRYVEGLSIEAFQPKEGDPGFVSPTPKKRARFRFTGQIADILETV
jgi:hypothetical protein